MWTNSKKTFAAFFALAAVAVLCLGAPPGVLRTSLLLRWTYPTNELSTNLTFKIYSHTNVTVAVTNWPLYATTVGTNLTHPIPVEDFKRFFVMTSSNVIGESGFSAVVERPAPPRDLNQLRLE